MDSGLKGIDFKNPAIFDGGIVPFLLHFEGFGVEQVDLVGKRGFAGKVLRGSEGEIGKSVGCVVEHLGIAGKFAGEYFEKCQRIVGSVVGHGAVDAVQSYSFFKVFICDLANGFFQ